MVAEDGIEPSLPKEQHFECCVSTSSTTRPFILLRSLDGDYKVYSATCTGMVLRVWLILFCSSK